jgi:hypothetical protein
MAMRPVRTQLVHRRTDREGGNADGAGVEAGALRKSFE